MIDMLTNKDFVKGGFFVLLMLISCIQLDEDVKVDMTTSQLDERYKFAEVEFRVSEYNIPEVMIGGEALERRNDVLTSALQLADVKLGDVQDWKILSWCSKVVSDRVPPIQIQEIMVEITLQDEQFIVFLSRSDRNQETLRWWPQKLDELEIPKRLVKKKGRLEIQDRQIFFNETNFGNNEHKPYIVPLKIFVYEQSDEMKKILEEGIGIENRKARYWDEFEPQPPPGLD